MYVPGTSSTAPADISSDPTLLRPTRYKVQQYVPGTTCTDVGLYLLARYYLGRMDPYSLFVTSMVYISVLVPSATAAAAAVLCSIIDIPGTAQFEYYSTR